jgi:hypothetical protein
MAAQATGTAVRSQAKAFWMRSASSDRQTGFGTKGTPAGNSGAMDVSQLWFVDAQFLC